MRMILQTCRRDDAFTLAELVVVVGLLGFVLAGAWAGMSVINKSQQVNHAASVTARDLSNPMEQMSRTIMQNSEVSSTDPNQIVVWTDRTQDGLPEKNSFYVNAGGELIWESWEYNATRSSFTKHNVWVMSDNNANSASGVDLFTYQDKNGVAITDMSHAPSDTRSVVVTLVADLGNGATAQDVRTILFRNRN